MKGRQLLLKDIKQKNTNIWKISMTNSCNYVLWCQIDQMNLFMRNILWTVMHQIKISNFGYA
jgi:hypothetical protein